MNEFKEFLFLLLQKIKMPNIDEKKYSRNCNHSKGPSSNFNRSNQVLPTIVPPKGRM
ncbi:hypothetical protein EU91_0063 [Prochlorococcus marinus str. GP2]|uniref:Uncharacterized protein n=1 Tax=Prochlorococcus marinus str. GP2 TaxID=59925 RepID=A0A0A1ZKA0_PROMR|nr:hypothetical protein EU91_0063 [Prochlorococcus marinus str. GP2]